VHSFACFARIFIHQLASTSTSTQLIHLVSHSPIHQFTFFPALHHCITLPILQLSDFPIFRSVSFRFGHFHSAASHS